MSIPAALTSASITTVTTSPPYTPGMGRLPLTLLLLALAASCRSSEAPRPPELPRLDCDRLLLETEIQSVCRAEIATRTASLGEGGTQTLCDRKFRTAEGHLFAFSVRHGAPAELRRDFDARAAAAGKLADHRVLFGLGDAAVRFTEPTPEGERRAIEIVRGRWRVALYTGQRQAKGPLCSLDELELLAKILLRRLR